MNDLYEEFEAERDKLNRLVVQAREKEQAVAADETIIMQSRKVDGIVGKLSKRDSMDIIRND